MTESTLGSSDETTEPTHFKKHKAVYISAGIVTAVGTAAFFLGRRSMRVSPEDITKLSAANTNAGAIIWKPVQNISQTVIRRGHPGFLVQCVETGEIFASLRRASDVLGIDRGGLSKHLHGLQDAVGGYTFKILGEAQ